MSSTRYAKAGTPFRPERFASHEAFKNPLSALLVAKRCALLRHDPELSELIWFIQDQVQPDTYNTGARAGSINNLAERLLDVAGYQARTQVYVEDLTGSDTQNDAPLEVIEVEGEEVRAKAVSDLVAALSNIALNPAQTPKALPGLGTGWREVIAIAREQVKKTVKAGLAPTSIAKRIAQALRFTMETGKVSLSMGNARLGKSAGAKAFCAASGGLARYVLTPEDNDMVSLYRALAKALGVADSASRKAADVRQVVERTLEASRLMLVFDEAHNLFGGARRITRQPQRVLWVRRLIDAGVPVAFVALPEFLTRTQRYITQIDWDSAQITDLIARAETLSAELSLADFELLVGRLAPDAPPSVKKLITTSANRQRGAQFVVDTLSVARFNAASSGRQMIMEEDVREAIGGRPQFDFGQGRRPAMATPASATQRANQSKAPIAPPVRGGCVVKA